jgi:hypothetical protein
MKAETVIGSFYKTKESIDKDLDRGDWCDSLPKQLAKLIDPLIGM